VVVSDGQAFTIGRTRSCGGEGAVPEKQSGKAYEGLAATVAVLRDAQRCCHSALMRTPWVLPGKGPSMVPSGADISTVDDVLL